MLKLFILSLFNELVRKRNSNLKELLNKSRNTSLDEIAYKNNMIKFDKEYIEDLENLINSIIKKLDDEKITNNICKNCKFFCPDPYGCVDGSCEYKKNLPVPKIVNINYTCENFKSK